MNDLELEAEAIQISIYCHIVCFMLYKHRTLSLIKILTFAYLVKKEKNICKSIYNSKSSKFLVNKALSTFSGEYQRYCNSIEVIMKAIHLLALNGNIKIKNNILSFHFLGEYSKELYDEDTFIYKAIENSKFKEDYQILKEVVQNV